MTHFAYPPTNIFSTHSGVFQIPALHPQMFKPHRVGILRLPLALSLVNFEYTAREYEWAKEQFERNERKNKGCVASLWNANDRLIAVALKLFLFDFFLSFFVKVKIICILSKNECCSRASNSQLLICICQNWKIFNYIATAWRQESH